MKFRSGQFPSSMAISWAINLNGSCFMTHKFNFAYSWIFMAMKTDFHDPLISVLDHRQLFMALKKVFMSHENLEMQYSWPWKKIHGFFISISWDFYEPAVGSVGQVPFFLLLLYFLTFRSTFEPSLYLAYRVVLFYLLFVGVFIIEEYHTLLTVCPRHRETYGVGWRAGKVRCSIPSEIAGHKSPSAKGDRGISSKESAFVLIAQETFLPIGTCKTIIIIILKKYFLTSLLLCRACKRWKFPSYNNNNNLFNHVNV